MSVESEYEELKKRYTNNPLPEDLVLWCPQAEWCYNRGLSLGLRVGVGSTIIGFIIGLFL